MFKLGLTGSIGSGKTKTAEMFAAEGCAVWDADAAVHRLYAKGGAAVAPLRALVPEAIVDGGVDRAILKTCIGSDPDLLKKIEAIVHPLVGADRAEFIAGVTSDIVVFDIPILFETGGNAAMDAVAVVWVDAETQRNRVLDRGTMSEDQLDLILSRQMPADEKRAKADYVIVTDTLENAAAQVQSVLEDIRGKLNASS